MITYGSPSHHAAPASGFRPVGDPDAAQSTQAHRWLGRIAAAALVLSAVSSFWMQARGHLPAQRILSVLTRVNLPTAIWLVRRGRVAAHQRAMQIHAGGLVIAGLFANFAPGRFLYVAMFG